MSIKATFPAGVTALTVHGLHQWDYGQQLEITHPDLPAIIEVHFAAVGSQEAIVRVVEAVGGVAEVRIPNELLEQTRPVLAWVYLVGETSGTTMLTVTLPVTPRARPGRGDDEIPEDVCNCYTELISEVNEVVGSVANGDLMVGRSAHATSADRAIEADHAKSADFATGASTASSALNALTANKATEADSAAYAEKAGTAASAPHLEAEDGTQFSRKTLWKNPSTFIITESSEGFMSAGALNTLELSEHPSGKWLVAQVSKLAKNDLDLYEIRYSFRTCAFRPLDAVNVQAGGFSQEVGGTTLRFYVKDKTLYYSSSEGAYILDKIYEEQ